MFDVNSNNNANIEMRNNAPLSFIPFNQSDLTTRLDPNKHKTLSGIFKKFNGLCELICNRILIDNSLGKGENKNAIKDRVTVERLNEQKITKSHILNVYSIFRKVIAFLFRIYPDNIFSCFDQWKLVNKKSSANKKIRSVNREILGKGLNSISDGETLKLEVFSRRFFSLSGHSLLIKKVQNNSFIFFDPNSGEHRNLSIEKLSDKIDEQLELQNGTDVFFTKSQTFLERLKKKIGEKTYNESSSSSNVD